MKLYYDFGEQLDCYEFYLDDEAAFDEVSKDFDLHVKKNKRNIDIVLGVFRTYISNKYKERAYHKYLLSSQELIVLSKGKN